MAQRDAITVMKTNPNKWWYAYEIYTKLNRPEHKPTILFSQLVKFGMIEKKEARPRTIKNKYQYRLISK